MIKLLIMDVDGTLTDGRIYIGAQGEAMKAFDVKDGYAIAHLLPRLGIEPVILTGRTSRIVEQRAAALGIRRLYQGVSDKAARLLDGVQGEQLRLFSDPRLLTKEDAAKCLTGQL